MSQSMLSEHDLSGDVDDFRKQVIEYNKIEEEIKNLESTIKPVRQQILKLKKEKTKMKKTICVYMNTNEVEKCDLKGKGTLVYKQRLKAAPMNKQTIRDQLCRYFCTDFGSKPEFNELTDIQKATSVFDYIYTERDNTYVEVLRHNKKK